MHGCSTSTLARGGRAVEHRCSGTSQRERNEANRKRTRRSRLLAGSRRTAQRQLARKQAAPAPLRLKPDVGSSNIDDAPSPEEQIAAGGRTTARCRVLRPLRQRTEAAAESDERPRLAPVSCQRRTRSGTTPKSALLRISPPAPRNIDHVSALILKKGLTGS